MELGDFETIIKVCVIGNGQVGKSTMATRYCKGHFSEKYKKTIGVDYVEKRLSVNEQEVVLHIFDTAGQEE